MNFKLLGVAALIGTAACGVLRSMWKLDHAVCSPMHEYILKEVADKVEKYRDEHPNEAFTDERMEQLHNRYYAETMSDLRRHQDEAFKNRFRRKH